MIRHQWLLIVAIAAGLVGMHHLVPAHTAHTMLTMANVTPTAHAHPGPFGVTPVAVASPLVPHADCCDPMDMVGHLCLAVLTAITALVAAMIFAAACRRPLAPGHPPSAVRAVAARAPPISCPRLTQLCVLRR